MAENGKYCILKIYQTNNYIIFELTMYKCDKCSKTFLTPSKLESHKKRINPCNKVKKEYKCDVCNISFTREQHKQNHEKTKKHITNIQINGNQNAVNSSNISNSFNNILHLTLNVKSFKNTDLTSLSDIYITQLSEFIKYEILENTKISEDTRLEKAFDEIIRLLKKVHFNFNLEENHNLKILIVFPNLKKTIFEYLILDINPETKDITWNSLKFEDLLDNILKNLYILNKRYNIKDYENFLNYLKENLLENAENLQKIKPIIDKKLSEVYLEFSSNGDREDKDDFLDKLAEYKGYRRQECKLANGFNPEITNSEIN